MCVSQWLTCSWRVTGRRGPPAARRHRSARSEGRDATPPGLGGGSPPGVGPLSRGAALRASSPPARPRPVPSRSVAHLRSAAAQLRAPHGRRRRRQLLLLPRPGPRRAPRPLAPPLSTPANHRSARPPAGHAPAPRRPMASQAPPPRAVPPTAPLSAVTAAGAARSLLHVRAAGRNHLYLLNRPPRSPRPAGPPLPLSLTASPHAGPASSPSSPRGEPPSPSPRMTPPTSLPLRPPPGPRPAHGTLRGAGPSGQCRGARRRCVGGGGEPLATRSARLPPSPRRGR